MFDFIVTRPVLLLVVISSSTDLGTILVGSILPAFRTTQNGNIQFHFIEI